MEPKIRFKGFEGGWKAEELAHVCSVNRGVRVTRNDLHNNGIYPVYQNTDYPMGYYTKFNVESNNPFVIVGGSAGLIGFCHTNFWAADDCVFFGDNPIINKSFLYNNLIFHKTEIKRNVRGASVPRLDRETLRKLPVSIPSLPEQQEIASYFTSLDSQISASTSRLASLKQMKSASLQAMFPQEGETVPKIRFKGFEGEWKKVKLGKLFSERIENNVDGEMLSVTMNNGIIKAAENGRFDNSNSDKSKYKVVKVGDIAYNSMRMWQGASGCSQYEGIVSPAYTVVVPNANIHSLFFAYLFKTIPMINLFRLHSQGLTKDTWNLKYPAFSIIEVSYPESKAEQQAIASYFTSLDRQISLQSQRLEKLKQIKSACLDKMFV